VKPRILFGLGNPGAEYENTPHNMGEAAVRAWALRVGLTFEKGAGPFLWTPVRREVRAVIPTTYMNVCGMAVSKLVALTGFKSDDFLVVTDDVWLPQGRMRLRTGGSDGGHNGLKSVAEALGTENYPRLRLGVGPVPERMDWADFVLRPFPSELQAAVAEHVDEAVDALNLIIARGHKQAQNVINRAADDEDEKKAEN
jgi:PTH1 family peptidyl-tRNA hydrolase